MTAAATGVRVARRPRRDSRRLRDFAIRWGALLGLAVVWEIAAQLAHSLFFPPLSRILERFVQLWLSGPPRPSSSPRRSGRTSCRASPGCSAAGRSP
ncbi:hypothetical protein [Naasia aerilata]|uniref:ABC transporter permease n=1 Tax=Naasia aerilata TaxID=1162966 RepID=A0ABM8G8Y4_9MICO|nr:hypothetical protein [Naasia aerilata]BDZ44646.1 hypothetical protein GCM10025866_05550 [Naasia aerilata]